MQTRWHNAEDGKGGQTQEFHITGVGQRDITGALWLPDEGLSTNTLVLCGHGASGNRYQAPIPDLASRFGAEGLAVLSLDGPVHGLRQVGPGGREAFFPEFRRDACLTDMTAEWHAAIDAAAAHAATTWSACAYFGLSMGSLFGMPLIASRSDICVATLGLVGVQSGRPHGDELLEAAAGVSCPTLFLMQLEDELFDREGYLRVFDALSADDKRIHANPGLHPEIPAEEIDFAVTFMLAHIRGTAERRIVNPLAE